jgi:Protein of unknown function (DUF3606)
MGKLTKKEQGDRSKIHIHDAQEVKCWAHKLGVSREDLRKVVNKVGDSAAGVRKELASEVIKSPGAPDLLSKGE